MRRWKLHAGIVLACLWMLYVFLHIGQLSVWRQIQPRHILTFRYALAQAQGVTTSPAPVTRAANKSGERFSSLNDLPSVRFEPLADGVKACSPTGLGPIKTPFKLADLSGHMTERVLPVLGGLWRPKDCVATHRVAVIVPYRNRPDNLAMVTTHLNFFLQQQKAEYGVFVIEQVSAS